MESGMNDNPFASPEADSPPGPVIPNLRRIVIRVVGGGIVLLLLLMLMLPAVRRGGGQASTRTQCRNNLRQIALALHNYHDSHGSFPPAYTVDEKGQPLHSWRTLLLPFMERTGLYMTIDLSKPWDDPVNRSALETELPEYRCPASAIKGNHTSYLGIAGEHFCFAGDVSRTFADITDGLSDTLMVIEVPKMHSVPWMAPWDADQLLLTQLRVPGEQTHHGGFNSLKADGAVVFISNSIEESVFQALLTIAADDVVGDF